MYRIYYDKKSAVIVDEDKRIFFCTTIETAKGISKERILTINPRTALHRQISLLIEVGYKKSNDDFEDH
ncbi:hypothetical protein [Enterococcus sp. AZ007]|uniref:hypothetical protein n=1 Tax=Enterococcus sp. AZ007 TaxID=2774839 RepID=UPI003F276390